MGNSNSCTLTELLFTNSNRNIKFIPTTLSRHGAVYTLPSQIGNNVDVLTVSGSTTSINALCLSSISLDKFSDTGISNPVSGQVLSYDSNGRVNSNTCALTQLNFTNSGHGINIVCPNLTRDGDTYALSNWVGNT